MKTLIVAALLICGLSAQPLEKITVNTKLPNDNIIHPMGDAEGTVSVSAEFVSEREILSVAQGNWRKVVKLITYKVSKSSEGFPDRNVTFICEDAFPAEGSRIKVKRFPWPFKHGTMDFRLKRDERALLAPFFEIVSYRTGR